MNLNTIIAALKSPKTPANLKKGLLKKYGHLLQDKKLSMSALASTVQANPRKKKFDGKFGKGYIGNPAGELHRINPAKKLKSFAIGDIVTLKDSEVAPRFRPYLRKYMIIGMGEYGMKVQDIDAGIKNFIAIEDYHRLKIIDKG